MAATGPGRDALLRTLRTAGRSVAFSAATVAAALAGLMVFPQRFLFSMGDRRRDRRRRRRHGGAGGAAGRAGAAGPRINALAPKAWRQPQRGRATRSSRRASGTGCPRARHAPPGPVAIVTAAALIILAPAGARHQVQRRGRARAAQRARPRARSPTPSSATSRTGSPSTPTFWRLGAPPDRRSQAPRRPRYAASLARAAVGHAVPPPLRRPRHLAHRRHLVGPRPLSAAEPALVGGHPRHPGARTGGRRGQRPRASSTRRPASARTCRCAIPSDGAWSPSIVLFMMTGSVVLPVKARDHEPAHPRRRARDAGVGLPGRPARGAPRLHQPRAPWT